eukprot:comp9098_c0_seq1/m.4268 comp9098_c0_seq1/g.4268  ORF comp9098_c0_seq1/g.4268 comp9098_c0_seq1/m.4268 type:complete len:142 (-) comp9098_c0_seq1:164-589(-)
MADRVKGQCLCGGIKFEVEKPAMCTLYCHCGLCRRMDGCLYTYLTLGNEDKVHLTETSTLTKYRNPKPEKDVLFCSKCGTHVGNHLFNKKIMVVSAGLLESCDDPSFKPSSHIFCEDKLSCYQLPDDGLPKYLQFFDSPTV